MRHAEVVTRADGVGAATSAGWPHRARIFLWGGVMVLLVLVRLPSLVQPAGADQGLYAYVGTRILQGELPYRDAWDQKPPAIHFAYALMFGVWPRDSVVAATDLVAALTVAIMLVPLGRAIAGSRAAGMTAAALFLFLGDPTLTRLAGVRVRSQCETFIAAALTASLLLAVSSRRPDSLRAFGAGALVGLSVTFKYNTAVYIPMVLVALIWSAGYAPREIWRRLAIAAAGVLVPILAMMAVFAAGSALNDVYAATITYNLQYSGETYSGPWSFVRYLATFPIQQARVDALWTLGGLGCLILLIKGTLDFLRKPHATNNGAAPPFLTLLPVIWVGAACLSIAINGSRGLPQYFVQAAPALALAAGVAAAAIWPAVHVAPRLRPLARIAGLALVTIAAWRVTDFSKIPRNAAHDLAYVTGRLSREEHLARYGGRAEDKYSALSLARLGDYLRQRTTPGARIYIFGFSPGAYVKAERPSASRFFWSRPVLVGFNSASPGYGPTGLLDELRASSPPYIVLQVHDWAPPPGDSATFFLADPQLGGWLKANYRRVGDFKDEDYDVWTRVQSRDAR